MGHKTLVNGTAYEVSGGKTLVNGTAYSISNGVTLVNGTAHRIEFGYEPVFADNSWEAIIQACHNNEVPNTWKVGDQKTMEISGVEYTIDIIGKNHDAYADGSGTAPLTFQMHDLHNDSSQMNYERTNSTGWPYSDMCKFYVPFIHSNMPTAVRDGIRLVTKYTSAGAQSTTLNKTSDALFLLSEVEISGNTINSYSGEGSQYAYYSEGNSKKKYKKGDTSATYWWTRSPNKGDDIRFVLVDGSGYLSYGVADFSYGVAPAFCF